ncbi:MAG: AMP-binding protein [Flavobacteriales bacterium]
MDFKDFKHITLNGKSFSKEEILEIANSGDSHLDKVLNFLKYWFDASSEITVQTSGSTGEPKQLAIPKQSFIESAKNTCEFLNLNAKTKALLCIPVKYIGGKMMVIRALFSGYNLIIQEPSANPLINLKEKIDFIAITTYQAYHISAEKAKQLENIKNVIIGGGKLDSLVAEILMKHSNNIYSTFGMTETVSHIGLKKINGNDKSENFTVFHAYKISKSEENCLIIEAPTLSESIIYTNDIVELISENEFKWLGRKDNIINSGGIKINPEEIEEILSPFLPRIEFIVTSLPDEKLGNKLILKVKKSKSSELGLMLDSINTVLPKHKTIKEIVFTEDFDYTETGKIIRRK